MERFSDYPISCMDLINWQMDGENASMPLVRLTVQEPLCLPDLNAALAQTRRRYAALNLVRGVRDGQFVYVQTDAANPVCEAEPQWPVALDTADGGFPWRLYCRQNQLWFCLHHGLFDGHAVFDVLKTLFYYYAQEQGRTVSAEGVCTLADSPARLAAEAEDPVPKCRTEAPPLPQKAPLPAGKLRADALLPAGQGRFCRVFVDKATFMHCVKQLETSPFALMSVLLARSLREQFDTAEPVVNIGVIADLRAVYGQPSMHNFTAMNVISYDCAAMDCRPLELCCQAFRSILDVMLQPENAGRSLLDAAQLEPLLRPMPLSEQARQILHAAAGRADEVSFVLSYIGRLECPGVLVTDLECHAVKGASRLIEMADVNGNFILNINHGFADDAFVQRLCAQLSALGVGWRR